MKLHNDLCYTVFSAPNYSGTNCNKGAVLQFTDPHSTTPTMIKFKGRHYPESPSTEHINLYVRLLTLGRDTSVAKADTTDGVDCVETTDSVDVKKRERKTGKKM